MGNYLVIKAMKKIEQKQARSESSLNLILKLTGSIVKYFKKLISVIEEKG